MSNHLNLLDLFSSADAGCEKSELALEQLFIEEPELHGSKHPYVECELPEALSEQEYIGIADELLCFTIREAFGVSRGGAQYHTDKKSAWMAWEWILSTSELDSDYPFSFDNCCRAAGVDPVELRDSLRSQRAAQFGGNTDGLTGTQLSF